MKNVVLSILFGIIGGLLGGMGMGGGTLLIPLMTFGLNVSQKSAQLINLVAFIPMSIIALFVHVKNKLIVKNGLCFVIIPAIFCCIFASIFATKIPEDVLKNAFGYFLIVLGAVYFLATILPKKSK